MTGCYYSSLLVSYTLFDSILIFQKAWYIFWAFSVGSQFYRTKTIHNDLNPVWNEYFEFVVDQADGQKLRIELFDYDKMSNDEELGRLAIDIDNIKKKRNLDDWFPLDACKHGDIHIKV